VSRAKDRPFSECSEGFSLRVRVIPNAHRNAVVGVEEGALVVRLAAPPVEGKANVALLEYLGDVLMVRPKQLRLQRGGKSRRKVVLITGVERARLESLGPPDKEKE
jgi:uncharacterized protein